MTAGARGDMILPTSQVEEFLRTMIKAQRAFQMYLPNNPMYQRAHEALRQGFTPIWNALDELVLTVQETAITWEEETVYDNMVKSESFAWSVYKDGMRVLVLRRGVEEREIFDFLGVLNQVRMLKADAGDDLLTLLWERDFEHLSYVFAEAGVEGVLPQAEPAPEPPPAAITSASVREEVAEAPKPRGAVDLDDFDSTLYFLDAGEQDYVRQMLAAEYARDDRADALATLMDVFELPEAREYQAEITEVLEHLFPSLLTTGEFRNAAGLLREVRLATGRVSDLPAELGERLLALDARLSEPAIVTQLLQALEEGGLAGAEADAAELLRELRPAALEAVVTYLPRLDDGPLRTLLMESATRIATANPPEVLRILRTPDTPAASGIAELAGQLKLEAAVPGLGELLRRPDTELRQVAVEALSAIGTAGAMAHLERALEDEDRAVRLTAVRVLADRGYRNALRRIEAVVLAKDVKERDLSEKMAWFEAYGAIAGPGGAAGMIGLLEPRGLLRRKAPSEVRACAALALGRIGTEEAMGALEAAARDKDLIVRNAANNALRARRT